MNTINFWSGFITAGIGRPRINVATEFGGMDNRHKQAVIDAHRGIDHRNKVKSIKGDVSITGSLWREKAGRKPSGTFTSLPTSQTSGSAISPHQRGHA